MTRFQPLLLEVWREACRHIEIEESIATIYRLLCDYLPAEQVVLRRLDAESGAIATVAAAPVAHADRLAEHRRQLAPGELQRVVRWSKRQRLLRRGIRGADVLQLVLPPHIETDVLGLPLDSRDGLEGILFVIARDHATFDADQVMLVESLSEPLSVAMQNDRRMHEMAKLRESAEADKGSLLRRLGRTDLEETIVGERSGLRDVIKRVMLVVQSDVPVLILGETGTGKEVIARVLHSRSGRQSGPFIRVNCGAIPAELIDSQLFGHEKGSFTGAAESRAGWFERADGGTLFLDEVGELPWEAQVRFLRVLQDGFVERVGGAQPLHVDVRVIAATHRDLATMVRQREFREDLWYRLAVFPIFLPPLRDRLGDIPEMAQHFAERAALRFGLPPVMPTLEDIRLLQSYDWPGNIRELGAVIDRAAILGEGQRLEVAKALGWTADHGTPQSVVSSTPSASSNIQVANNWLSLDDAMRQHIQTVLQVTRGQIEGRGGAAAILKVNPHTLRARMRKLQIDWSKYRPQ